ncbi:PAS domain-containing protein [Halomicrobium sp. HM KBTZ05]|uniref:PAS domain-containing protein n=1 Tax=Halomicrobium mukohataei TaxID=57705 RepID=A0A847U6T9_9EURY|nr:PAS domain-containing protein [Halomicrobium mukohataei]NLV11453.1 PAS domain-containing protein [Halomicrobium mukohataei]
MDTTIETTPVRPTSARPATVLCVDADREYLSAIERAFEDRDDLQVRVETDPSAVPDRLDGVDCLVSAYRFDGSDGLELLRAVREVAPSVPFLLHSAVPFEEIDRDTLWDGPTDYLEKASGDSHMALLAYRIGRLVGRHRLTTSARRCHEALEASREATLIVTPDGTVTFANNRLATELSASPAELRGREWTELLEAASVRRLRTEAFPVAADGWSWTGQTTLATDADDPSSSRTTLSTLDDGSAILVFHELDRTDE